MVVGDSDGTSRWWFQVGPGAGCAGMMVTFVHHISHTFSGKHFISRVQSEECGHHSFLRDSDRHVSAGDISA